MTNKQLREYKRDYRNRKIEEGLCPDCGGFKSDKYYRCFKCRQKRAEQKRRLNDTRKADGRREETSQIES